MAAESRIPTKNPKTQTIRCWIRKDRELPSDGSPVTREYQVTRYRKGRPGSAKEALEEDIPTTERYSPDDLKKWLAKEDFKKKGQR
jgi:hypothetical protein